MYDKNKASIAFDMRVVGYKDTEIAEFLEVSTSYVKRLITTLCIREKLR